MVLGHKKLEHSKVNALRPFVTIITVCFNNEHTIENTILSVKSKNMQTMNI